MLMTMEEFAELNGVSYWTIRRHVLAGNIVADKSRRKWLINTAMNEHYHSKLEPISSHPLYTKWKQMKNRCNNPKHKGYKYYGAKGIKVCPEWHNSFKEFLNWSNENGYMPGLSLDRIDSNGDYTPLNCRWATWKEQGETRTNNVVKLIPITVTISNETKTILTEKALKVNMSISGYIRNLIEADEAQP